MSANNPLISVIMPAYNHQAYVGVAIESVLTQTFSDFEFIIVNDGSTDATLQVINGYKDDRLKIVDQKNQDAFNAINKGVMQASGKYISILNSDDVYHPERLAVLYRLASSNGFCFAFTGVNYIDSKGAGIMADDPRQRTYQRLLRLYRESGSLSLVMLSGKSRCHNIEFLY